MIQALKTLFVRDLEKLIVQLEGYSSDAAVWLLAGEIKNSAGTLALHLVGNLNQYIGVGLGHTDYVRDRPAEFATRDVPRAKLISQVKATITLLERVLGPDITLETLYPNEVLGYPMTTQYFLIHLYGHLNWHLGQIDYHRRLTQ